jgi:segregation and condensation protein B
MKMPSNSPKMTKKPAKPPTETSKEGKEADPLAGIEDLVEDMPEKAPTAEESKKEEIIEDIDANSFDLKPEEEVELSKALGKEPETTELPEKAPAATPEELVEPEIEEGAEAPAEGETPQEGSLDEQEGEAGLEAEDAETPSGETEEAVPPQEGIPPAEGGTVPPPAEEPAGTPGEAREGAEAAAPAKFEGIKFDTEEAPAVKGLDEKSLAKVMIEASLFVSDKPVSIEDLSIKLELRKSLVTDTLKDLIMDYMDRVTSLEIVKVGEDTYTMQIRPEYTSKVKKFASGGLIPEGVMRTLTIIALKQPISKSLLVKLRGSGAYEHVKDLEDRGLVRSERAGRTQNVTTTDQFADMFGLSREIKKMKMQLKAQLGVKEEDEKEDTTPKAPPPVPEG